MISSTGYTTAQNISLVADYKLYNHNTLNTIYVNKHGHHMGSVIMMAMVDVVS